MSDQKTEKPTQQRLRKARQDGQFATSREFVSAIQFLAVLFLIGHYGRAWWLDVQSLMAGVIARAFRESMTPGEITNLAVTVLLTAFVPLFKAGAAVALVTLSVHFAITRFGFSLARLKPKAANLNPVKKLLELPRQNAQAVLQSLVTLAVCALVFYCLAARKFEELSLLPVSHIVTAIETVFRSFHDLLWTAAWGLLLIGVVDFVRQQSKFNRQMRMTRQEVRDEFRNNEGNPQIKARRHRLRREQARRRMMRRVPQATVVVMNPTHFAVALRYDSEAGAAPTVVAKGKNYLALRIRRLAETHHVPVVENPPLAQALYKSVPLGGEIPAALYRAVAELLAYVYIHLGRG